MSLDFHMISRMIVDGLSSSKKEETKTETFNEAPVAKTADAYIGKTELMVLQVLSWVVSLLLSFIALYLSWSCNTAMGYTIALKAVFGAMAFFFGLTYIILFFVMRWDVCRKAI